MTKSIQKPVLPLSAEPPTVERLLKAVLRSGLLDRGKLQAALRDVALDRRDDPEAVADHLVKTGRLSRFQARKLLQGMPGGLVLGPFQILAPIGKGGMGTVYLARDVRGDQLQALKVLTPKRARESERLLARFRREMEMCQRVAHPHIAWTCDVGVCQGVYYIAMEYIPGRSLYRIVNDEGPLDVSRAARLFGEVAEALDHAHHQGLIHRDLKPSNVQITPNDHAKLLDLGLAIVQGEAAASREVVGGQGYVVGTMDYIAPEQTENAAGVDPRSDIYAFGSTLYFALTGRPPFPGGTALEKVQRHRSEEPLPIEQINPRVPVSFCGLVRRLMAKDPADRMPTALAVVEELHAWANGEAVRPLDRPGDSKYEKAVHDIESAEPSVELIAEPLPVEEPVGEAVLIGEEIPVGKPVGCGPRKSSARRSAPRLPQAPPPLTWENRPSSVIGLLLVLIAIATAAVGALLLWGH
ncbi:MAG TPA: serine/threonine-protein kinase [Gemmataceae bacterium]|nr:serine/threonine-protein kinase [Gemmataceae bacterium]